MGRKKITIKPIDCPRLRSVTFYKRRKGLLKKAMELAVLCQSHVFLAFVDNETGKLVTFNSHSVKALRDLFRKTPLHLRENFKAQDYDFLYGDSQTCNKSGKLPQRDQNNVKIEDEDEQVFDQIYAGQSGGGQSGGGEGEQTRIMKRNSKRNLKNNQKATKMQSRSCNLSNDVKLCDNDSEEDKELGLLEQNNSEEGEEEQQSELFGQKKLIQGQQQQQQQQQQKQLQQQSKHLTQYQNEDNSQNHQNFRFTSSCQYDQSRARGQVTHKSDLKLNEINDMMNLFQEDQSNDYEMTRKILNENMHIDQTSQKQQDDSQQQIPFKDTQKKMKQKLKIQNIDIANEHKAHPYKLNKMQSFEFMPNKIERNQNKQQSIDDQNSSSNTASLLQAASQQLAQNGSNSNQIPQLQQQLLNNQALYQQLKSINPLQSQFNYMSPYPLLLTPSPFPSSLFLPNLGASLATPNNPLGMNQPSQLGFDFMNHPLLSSTSPLFQGLFNPQELTPGVGGGTTTPLQNPLSFKTAVNNFLNNNNNNQQGLTKDKNQGSDCKQLNNLDSNSAAEQAKNYYNSILNNLKPQTQGLNLQSLNQASCLSDNQREKQQQQQQSESLQSQNSQRLQSAEKQ